ncbi:MAG: YraN family protein [Elusimicrobia bacterium]|nr:YraN family protein [Elusimicrobiota bacterium]
MLIEKTTRQIGQEKEKEALHFFEEKGWKLIAKNVLCRGGEIDLIFKDQENTIIFVEVKYRSSLSHGVPQLTVLPYKQNRLIKSALTFIKKNNLQGHDFRFDVLALFPAGIEHIPNAFSSAKYSI